MNLLCVKSRLRYSAELAFYKEHHINKCNIHIHALCIPLEWFSWFVLLNYIQVIPFIISTIVGMHYLFLNVNASYITAISIVILEYLAKIVFTSVNYAWIWAFAIQFLSWGIQVFIGHYYYEKNSPGMTKRLTLESIVLSLLMAWDVIFDD